MLERHRLNTKQLWTTKVPEIFSFAARNSDQIKVKQNRKARSTQCALTQAEGTLFDL